MSISISEFQNDGVAVDSLDNSPVPPYGETCEEFFGELEDALPEVPDYRAVYRKYRSVFNRLIDQHTASVKIVFRGPYPKTDYLLKERDAHWQVRKHVHDARVRLRRLASLTDQELKDRHLHDLQALCEFVALIYGVSVPRSLQGLFPKEGRSDGIRYSAFADSVRMLVASWDDDHFYGKIEAAETEQDIRVAFAAAHNDRSYLKDLLSPDCLVNLVRPCWVEEGEEVSAEFVIYEPDYLVDISNIASCFEQYATSPYISLINKLKPHPPTAATTLGHLAGEVLDNTLHPGEGGVDLRATTRHFMKDNALTMALMTEEERQKMWSDTQRQAQNISNAINVGLPDVMKDRFQPDKVMVEPTFFAEMLGMQGRMDFLQTDGLLLLEQKAGKGAFPYDNFSVPRATEPHIVQVTLYMYILRYAFHNLYGADSRNAQSFLLYSKYRNSLYSQGYNAGGLLADAIEVRNRIAWCEAQYAGGDGFRWLDSLSANVMNRKKVDNPLWNNWQKPAIDELLSYIKGASELEQAYFYRMMRFVANEHMLAKTGNKTKENTGFASKWYDSLEEKLAAGNIYDSLRLDLPDSRTRGPFDTLRLTFHETDANDMANFRVGDIVVAYPYDEGTEPDVRRSMVFRCTIEDIDADSITLRMRASQSSLHVFLKDRERPWAIEHDFYESSYSALYRGVYAFLKAPQERRDLLMLQREPETDSAITALKSRVPDGFQDLALRVKQARDLFLIIGPPGTGKTSYGLMTTVREQLAEEGTAVLLMSYTNRAVDEICGKLIEEGIDFIRIGSRLSTSQESRPYLLSERVSGMQRLDGVRQALQAARVFVGTTASLTSQQSLFQLRQFDLAIIDEASQILEPHLLPLLSATHNERPVIRKFVMIGDHKQLPAVVQQTEDVSRVQEPLLRDILLTDCRLSLFERMLKRYGSDPRVTYMLTHQGRMHPDIAHFPNHAFYAGRLTAVPLPHQDRTLPADISAANGLERMLGTRRVAFIAVDAPEKSPSDKVNQAEADVIAAIVMTIYRLNRKDFKPTETVGVIVPYRNQIATVRNTILRSGITELADITIDTVERYQGSQRKYIVYGFTIQQRYQMRFLAANVFEDTDGSIVDRKLNVAMTRAEEGLVMVGNPALLAINPIFRRLMEHVKTRGAFFHAPLEDIVTGNFTVPAAQ